MHEYYLHHRWPRDLPGVSTCSTEHIGPGQLKEEARDALTPCRAVTSTRSSVPRSGVCMVRRHLAPRLKRTAFFLHCCRLEYDRGRSTTVVAPGELLSDNSAIVLIEF